MYLYCINFHGHDSLLFLLCNDLLHRDLGIKPIMSHFVESLPKFGYFFFLIIVHTSGDSSFLWLLGLDINSVKKTVKKTIK